jgi:hypothetical protein
MINQGNDVPKNTIAVFSHLPTTESSEKDAERLFNIIGKPGKKRDWFTPHFYRCLPLSIGNQYGFVIKSEFDISFIWNGGEDHESIMFYFYEEEEVIKSKYPRIDTHFGSGIITINPPFTLRTPPGINLMTINPPNHVIPNITVMTGVIESDNIRRNFTFNLKVQIPNIEVFIPKGTPLAAFIPIPRYFADNFELKLAEDIFSDDEVIEEIQAMTDATISREEIEPTNKHGVGKHYLLGKDIYGNIFTDHQKS